MKKSLIIMPFSALLLASSGILSNPTGVINIASVHASTANKSQTVNYQKPSPLILAKINTPGEHSDYPTTNTINSVSPINSDAVKIKIAPADIDSTQTGSEQADSEQTGNTKSTSNPLSSEEMAHLRQLFLQAENALKKKDDAAYFLLAEQLKAYPLYPYLQYTWLKKNLHRERQIKHFLQHHSASRYAAILKRKWLHYLGKHKQWPLLLENRIATKNASLNCYFHRAEYQTGNKAAALAGAQHFWAVGYSQPHACDPLFKKLQKSSFFTQYLRWQRFDAALKNNKLPLASYVKKLMPRQYHSTAQLWLKLHRNPALYMPQLLKLPRSNETALMFRHAIDRLAGKDIIAAIKIWDANKIHFTVNKKLADKLEKRLALKLVFEREAGAFDRLGQLDKQDYSSRAWRVRVALGAQNWQQVLTAIQALNDKEKASEKWQYWLARAYLETDNIETAQILLSQLSGKRSFYGFLAADRVNSLYQLSANPVQVSSEELTELKNQNEFMVAFEFMILDRKNDAKLQWWHATRPLNHKEIIIAAKLAQQWQWDEIAIFTIAKAKHWDDIELRFPVSYADKILENSIKHKLNPAIIFGLVRRESAFNEKAYSPVGARGLMQIMPGTGRQIARNLNERWRGNNSLYNPVTNIRYGAYYYQKLLKRFDGHYAIALAAYNAGPQRVKKWLPKDQAMPADIWIETIPFKETREYVSNVLAYTLIYQQRTTNDNPANENLTMAELTRKITPLAITH